MKKTLLICTCISIFVNIIMCVYVCNTNTLLNDYKAIFVNSINSADECLKNYSRYAAEKDYWEGVSNLYIAAKISMTENRSYSKGLYTVSDYILLYPDKAKLHVNEITEIIHLIKISDDVNVDIKISELINIFAVR